jgi:hypothetical protein
MAFANVTLNKQAVKITTGEAKKFVDAVQAGAGHGVEVELEARAASV